MGIFSPNFDNDIFINYSRADNEEPLDENNKGWVDALHEKLHKRLWQLTGVKPEIWRDIEKMPGHAYMNPTLILTLRRVALLISILSPCYLTSEFCIPELSEFYQSVTKTNGIPLTYKSRIFKVIKTPIPREKHPELLKDLPGYEFYDTDRSGMPREYSHIKEYDGHKDFVRKLELLAWEIKQFVDLCHNADPYPRTVYLAETGAELKKERDEIKSELEMHNYHILPDKELPTNGPEFEKAVRAYLDRSTLSIHLIGGDLSFIPAGNKRDAIYLQHWLAMKRQSSPDFFRVIWMPMGLKVREHVQQKFVNYLRKRSQVQENAELLLSNTSLPNLKTYLLNKLGSMQLRRTRDTAAPPPQVRPTTADDEVTGHWEEQVTRKEPTRVYLMFDKKDLETARPLLSYLAKNYNVTWPVMDGRGKQIKQNSEDHIRNLSECDVAIIFYGSVKEFWVREKLNDLEKIIATGRTKPRPISTLYIAGQMNDAKELYETNPDYRVIKNHGKFSSEPLEPLVAEIKKRFSRTISKGMAR